jgi:glycosyltransferase involved in cell wall biosynthesis
MTMRIAIDARYLSHGLVGGVHTYTRNLIDGLLRRDQVNEYVLWADTKAAFELPKLPANAELRTLPWSGPASSARNDRRIGTAMLRAGADVTHFPANFGFAPGWMPRVITLHDAINILPLSEIVRGHRKDVKTLLTMTYLHTMTRRALQGNPTVITVSEYSRREILRHSQLDPEQVRVVYSAPEPVFQPLAAGEVEEFRRRIGARELVVLGDAIKNPVSVLRAYRTLRAELRERASLVFYARRQPAPEVVDAAASGECLLLMRPPTDDLVRLYNLARVFVFPSLYEGFGLPVLEAMACGAPVVTSDRGSLPEVTGEAGLTVGPDDYRAIAAAMTRVLGNDDYARRLSAAGITWASGFTWDATARGVLDVYNAAYHAMASPAASVRLAAV